MWREDPATSMVIGWDQVSGSNPVLYFSEKNREELVLSEAKAHTPDRVLLARGMNNHFVRLRGLQPNTMYHFCIQDNEGASDTYSFQTAPASPYSRLSIIAGGDSRNNRSARVKANKLVGKLRPHFVLFGGDMTASDNARQWLGWFDDWQHTISADGRLTPIVVARGNHEYSNKTLIDLFDVAEPTLYYAHTFASDLLRIYTLNSLMPAGGDQKEWLERDLRQNWHIQWKMAQYHQTIRPHTREKPEKNQMLLHWATLFDRYKVDLVVESDAHVVKTTYPVRPSNQSGSDEGFVRDDLNGTVYIGEGCWGAPLRRNNDDKSWTRASGSFNQFKWIFIDRNQIEIRTIKTDNVEEVGIIDPFNVFIPPLGLDIWQPETGAVVTIHKNSPYAQQTSNVYPDERLTMPGKVPLEISGFRAIPQNQDFEISWSALNETPGYYFELQRSSGHTFYQTVAKLEGQAQQQAGDFKYRLVDKGTGLAARGKYIRYRVKYIRPDGQERFYYPPVPRLEGGGLFVTNNGIPKLTTNDREQLQIRYELSQQADVSCQIFDVNRQEVYCNYFNDQPPRNYLQTLDLDVLPRGRYVLIVSANEQEIERFRVEKR